MVTPPGGRRAYLIGGDPSMIDTGTNTVTGTVRAGTLPTSGAVSHDGRRLYLADSAEGTVTIVDTVGL